jgi:hypothetical protein
MAADCKSAAPCELRRFESSPVHQVFREAPIAAVARVGVAEMKRLWTALGLFAVLAVLAWTTISDQRFRLAAVAVLAMFAVRTWTWSRKQEREQRERRDE